MVVAGGGLAGIRTVAALRDAGFDGRVTMLDRDPECDHDRPPLSKGFLTGTHSEADIRLPRAAELDADERVTAEAAGLSARERVLHLRGGVSLGFDGLVIATGLRARTLPGSVRVPTIRSIHDARRLRAALTGRAGRLVVIGAGFIGTELAASARELGWQVTLIARESNPLTRALGQTMGRFVADLHWRHGVDVRAGQGAHEVTDTPDGYRVRLAGGEVIEADLVVAAIGAIPNTEWLDDTEILTGDGVHTDAGLRVLDRARVPVSGIVAAGDVARSPHPLFPVESVRVEHWSNANEHAKTAAATLLADLSNTAPVVRHAAVPSFWSDQYDQKILAVGLPHLADYATVVEGDPSEGRFLIAYTRNQQTVGAAGVGTTRSLARYRRAIATATQRENPPQAITDGGGPSAVSTTQEET
ncbi:FAD/NAD(P)-binding oxidoreductase [Micrococcus luteus]|uniref:NAD(P)/FAD-dependent oxidoreductase n=1 Tax=Micrococcus luteus TaxID=1270 RepID=UPI0034199D6D